MADDNSNARAQAVAQLTDEPKRADGDQCGPEAQRPDYFSPQAVRDKWMTWKLCKEGA